MAERAARRSSRTERHELSDEVENFQEAMSSIWGTTFPMSRMSEFLISWNEKTGAQLKAARSLASAMNALAQRQGKLMVELAQSVEMETPGNGRTHSASMKLKTDKIDHIFDEAADILREAGHIVSEAQVNALNLLRPAEGMGNPRLVASVDDKEAA